MLNDRISARALSSILLALALAGGGVLACGGDDDDDGGGETEGPSGASCPDNSTLTYATFGQQFATDYCVSCHASALTGDARNGAPIGYDFDTLAGIMAHADDIDVEAAAGPDFTNDGMPEGTGAKPSTAEREDLGEWLACGTPE